MGFVAYGLHRDTFSEIIKGKKEYTQNPFLKYG